MASMHNIPLDSRRCRFAFWATLVLTCGLAGCASNVPQMAQARYDLFEGSAAAATVADQPVATATRPSLQLSLSDIETPSWLATSAMQYRLSYVTAGQRLAFAESRWVAPPAELLAQVLRSSPLLAGRPGAESCRLHLRLDELIQVFSAPDSSQVLIEMTAMLLDKPSGASRVLAERTFRQVRMAGGDAQSGVAAFAVATRELRTNLELWLNGLQQVDPGLQAICRVKPVKVS